MALELSMMNMWQPLIISDQMIEEISKKEHNMDLIRGGNRIFGPFKDFAPWIEYKRGNLGFYTTFKDLWHTKNKNLDSRNH